MRVRYSTKHTISVTIAFLLLSIVPSAYASSTVSIQNDSPTYFQPQRKVLRSDSYYWVCFSNTTYLNYCSSSDGSTWSSPTVIRTSLAGSSSSFRYAKISGVEYFYYAYANNTVSNNIFFCRGNISGASITWGTEYSLRVVTNEYEMYPDVEVVSDGTVFVVSGSFYNALGGRLYCRVFKNANNDGSGAWTTSLTVTLVSSGATAADSVVSALTALNSSMVYMITYNDQTFVSKGYLYNSTWSSVETIFSTEINKNFGIASFNNTVYFAYNYVWVRYCKVRDPTTGWGSAETISSVGGYYTGVQLCADSNGDVYAFWGAAANITYCKRSSGAWGSVTHWKTSETDLLTPSITCYPMVIDNAIAVVWSKGVGTIYVMFDLLNLGVAKSWHDVSTWTASLGTRTWSSGTSWTENLQTRIWNWIPTAWYYIPTTDLIDSYSESNYNFTSYLQELHPSPNPKISAEGQSFTMLSSDRMITSCKFYLYKYGSPTGMAHAVLYAHQGIYGTNSTPTGEALATSDAFDVSTLTLSIQLITFTFNSSQQYVMKANTYYCIAFENPTSGTISGMICPLMGFHYGSPTHSGNNFLYVSSAYVPAFTSFDTIFYVYGKSFGGFSLLTRQYITVASWLFDFGTRIWVDAAAWTYNLVTMAWQDISWIFYLGTSIWTDIATWGASLLAMMWNDVATYTINLFSMAWHDLAWLFTLLPRLPEWVNVAVWIFSLRSPEWMLVALWNLQLGPAGVIAFLFIAILLLIVIVAGIIVITYRRPKR